MSDSFFPHNLESKVGFDLIREQVASLCLCPLGAAKVWAAAFSTSYHDIIWQLDLTHEMKQICLMESSFPIDNYADPTAFLARVEGEGSWLDEGEILTLRKSLETIKQIVGFVKKKDESKYPTVRKLSEGISFFPYITERIDSIIDRFGKVKDNASPELAQIRSAITSRQNSVSKKIGSILKLAKAKGIVDSDVSPSLRDGRIVIPVIAANKRKIKGFVHDESASGKTVFIEPAELVELNNEIRELEYQERREVVKILVDFADSLCPYLPDLKESYDFLGTIDFIRAKALYAINHKGAKPIIVNEPKVYLRQAFHPLLMRALRKEGREVVPLDINLDSSNHILLISGPNAGGKSVCLKTVGVAQVMMQSGFLPPVLENSEMGIFTNIFIDIGDEQSLENDLSTYSSHLMSMKHFLRNSNSSSLVLIDEFGAGTEPVVGGAIAESILERLNEVGAYGVITTHYSNLKLFASTSNGVINGAMLFDTGRIEPLFRLEVGKPGSSFAFEIARKIGLPEELLKRAEAKVGTDHVSSEKYLREISRDKRYWERKRNSIRLSNKRIEELEGKLEGELLKLQEQKAEIIKNAKKEAESILNQSNKIIENTIRGIKEANAEKERTRTLRTELEDFKGKAIGDGSPDPKKDAIERKVEQLNQRKQRRQERSRSKDSASSTSEKIVDKEDLRPLDKGDKVQIAGQDAMGEVMEVSERNVVVAFGSMITTISVERLLRVSSTEFRQAQRAVRTPNSGFSQSLSKKRLSFKSDIDVRGCRVEEAVAQVQDLVDEATVIGYPRVRILHGKGNGVLRQQIRVFLKANPCVSGYRDEPEELGGTGITIVDIG